MKQGRLADSDFGLTQGEMILPTHWLAQLCRQDLGPEGPQNSSNGQSQKKSHRWTSTHLWFKDEGKPLTGQSGFSAPSFQPPPLHPWHGAQPTVIAQKVLVSFPSFTLPKAGQIYLMFVRCANCLGFLVGNTPKNTFQLQI